MSFRVRRRDSSERSNRGNSSSRPATAGSRTRSASSSSSWPVSSPSRTTIVLPFTSADTSGAMGRKGGWRRAGSPGRFRYYDARGNVIRDDAKLARIQSLVIPPAWTDVWISPRPAAKLQATGLDKAGRRQYLYHPEFRAQQEQAKYDKLIRFAEKLPDLRLAMGEHIMLEGLHTDRLSAVAVRLINLTWFRVGSERYV